MADMTTEQKLSAIQVLLGQPVIPVQTDGRWVFNLADHVETALGGEVRYVGEDRDAVVSMTWAQLVTAMGVRALPDGTWRLWDGDEWIDAPRAA